MSKGDQKGGNGRPVPVRDLMRPVRRPPASDREQGGGEAAGTLPEIAFEMDGAQWTARAAGHGAYGTGRTGAARLVAIHFYRGDEPDTPVREALLGAGAFAGLRPDELRVLFDRATPIDLDR